MANKSGSLLR